MPQTPLTGSAPYASPEDLAMFKDYRQTDQLSADGGQSWYEAVVAMLAAASGRVEEYVLTGGRYSPADLAALTGNAAARLKELVCELAFFRLKNRRWPTVGDKGLADVLESLERLAQGVTIFGTVEAVAASKPTTAPFNAACGEENVVRRAERMFGRRKER